MEEEDLEWKNIEETTNETIVLGEKMQVKRPRGPPGFSHDSLRIPNVHIRAPALLTPKTHEKTSKKGIEESLKGPLQFRRIEESEAESTSVSEKYGPDAERQDEG